MAREKHIVDLTIGNFKRFADFEVKNLGQFNLIVGDNNTGKTSFLEALLIDEDDSIFRMIEGLVYSICIRSAEYTLNVSTHREYLYNHFTIFLNKIIKSDIISILIKKTDTTYNINFRKFNHNIDLDALNSFEKEKLFSSDELQNEFIFSINDAISTTLSPKIVASNYFPFIPFGLGHDKYLIDYYSGYIDVNKTTREKFIEWLQILIPKVNDVRVGNDVINIYEEGIDTPMPLFTYGEGANKLFRILCEIAMCKGKRLMIDEIDAGIHYSRFKSFWRTIMQAAKAYDVQIFATTHNIECIEYFREVLEEDAMQEYQELARIVSLKVKEDNSVKARVYDYEYMEYAKDANRELRGGGL
jgi:AAA15 family ATPase/GTPase